MASNVRRGNGQKHCRDEREASGRRESKKDGWISEVLNEGRGGLTLLFRRSFVQQHFDKLEKREGGGMHWGEAGGRGALR